MAPAVSGYLVSRSSRTSFRRLKTLRRLSVEQLEAREVFDASYFDLGSGNFSQNWSNTGLITTANDWSTVPSIIGYRGDDITSAQGVDPRTLLGEGTIVVNVSPNLTNPNTATSGGVAEFEIADPVVALQGSGTADAPNLLIHLNTTGRGNIAVSYRVRDIDGSTDNAIQPVALQYRVGSTGNFTNIPAGYIADATTGPGQATQETFVTATLPVAAENQAQVQVRVLTTNAAGNDEWVGIDDILITSDVFVPSSNPNFTIVTDAGSGLKAEGNSGTTSYTFTVTRNANTTVAASVDWSIVGGVVAGATSPADASDFTSPSSGTVNFAIGETAKTITVQVTGDTAVEADEGYSVVLSNPLPVGATIGAGQGSANAAIANDDAVQNLLPGELVLTAVSGAPAPDLFTFVPLVNLTAGMVVYFTDNGWSAAGAAGALGTVEGVVTFTVGTAGLARGTKVQIEADAGVASVTPSTAGNATVSGVFNITNSGDSLLAYIASPLMPKMLFGVNLGNSWTPASFANSTTFLPPDLLIGQSAVDTLTTTFVPQAQFDHTPSVGSATMLRDAVADKTNWVTDASTTVRMPINGSNLTVGAAAIVSPVAGLVTTEAGGTASFTVVLTEAPTADVVIGLSSSNTGEGTVAPASLTFNSTNWNTPQTVTVTGVDDPTIDGDVSFSIITTNTTSADPAYNNLPVEDVSVTNRDNDLPGVTVTPTSGLITTELGGTATFSVVLTSQPAANVTIALTSSNTAEGTVGPASLVFTASNWSIPQTATVTGVDDSVIDGAVAYTIQTVATSPDSNYNNIAVADVSVTNLDNDRNTSALINEILQNPAGSASDNPFEYIELIGTPGSVLTGYYFVQFEGDGATARGAADFVVNLSSYVFGANGLLVIQAPAGGFTVPSATTVVSDAQLNNTGGGIENGTVTSMLIYSPDLPIVEGTDYDTGAGLNLPSGAIVQDSIGWTDGGVDDAVYGGVVLTIASTAPAADAASRIVGNVTANSVSAWYGGDMSDTLGNASLGYDPARGSANLPAGAVITPGDTNYVAPNQNPVVTSNASSVNANEGTTVTNTGTWSDADASDVVTLTASLGTVVKNDDGTWSWSIPATDDLPSTSVTITASDGQGGTASATFTYSVSNLDPTVAVNNLSVSGQVLASITNSGTYSDVAADTVTLSSSVGTIVKNANGTWSWSITPSASVSNQLVTITAADEDGGVATTSFTYSAIVTVTNRRVFYNNSQFENSAGVAGALDPGKVLLTPGPVSQTTGPANVIGYTLGINGVVLDVAGLATNSLTAADFIFRVAPPGASGVVNPSTWAFAPAPSAIVVTAGTGSTPARVQLEWTNNAIQNTWLQIIVRANSNTGLPAAAVFYLGHALGDVNMTASYRVTGADLSMIQAAISNALVSVDNPRDVNKDRRITGADLSFIQARISNTVLLNNIIIPAEGSSQEGSGSVIPPTIWFNNPLPGGPGELMAQRDSLETQASRESFGHGQSIGSSVAGSISKANVSQYLSAATSGTGAKPQPQNVDEILGNPLDSLLNEVWIRLS